MSCCCDTAAEGGPDGKRRRFFVMRIPPPRHAAVQLPLHLVTLGPWHPRRSGDGTGDFSLSGGGNPITDPPSPVALGRELGHGQKS